MQFGDTVIARAEAARVEVGPQLLGRVLDGFGKPMDGGPAIDPESRCTICTRRRRVRFEREHITEPLVTGDSRDRQPDAARDAGNAWGFSEGRASAKARCWARWRGTIRPMSA